MIIPLGSPAVRFFQVFQSSKNIKKNSKKNIYNNQTGKIRVFLDLVEQNKKTRSLLSLYFAFLPILDGDDGDQIVLGDDVFSPTMK